MHLNFSKQDAFTDLWGVNKMHLHFSGDVVCLPMDFVYSPIRRQGGDNGVAMMAEAVEDGICGRRW